MVFDSYIFVYLESEGHKVIAEYDADVDFDNFAEGYSHFVECFECFE